MNYDCAYCIAKDCKNYETCERAIPPDADPDRPLWLMEKCEEYETNGDDQK